MSYPTPKEFFNDVPSTFISGYNTHTQQYHNIGQLQTPYMGKGWKLGDYGPPQATIYYRDNNRHYPYPLDRDSMPSQGIPQMQPKCFPCSYNSAATDCRKASYPTRYIPEKYFYPQVVASPFN